MSATVTYKGSTLTTVENATKKLTTKGTWLEDDITIQDVSSGGGGSVLVVDTPDSHGGTIREITATNTVMLQGQKTVSLTTSPQTITPDTGYDGFASVIVDAGTNQVAPFSDVNFIDHDGTIRYSYTISQINELSELPPNPSHAGFISQGWNWTLADIKTQMTEIPQQPLFVGQLYVTESGKTEIDLEVAYDRTLYLGLAINGTVSIDWGDSSATDTVTGTSASTQKRTGHTYTKGSYTITIDVISGNAYLYNTDGYPLINTNSSASTFFQDQLCLFIKNVRLGTNMAVSTRAFNRVKKMKAFNFRSGATSTPTRCFEANALWYVSLPKSITTINGQTFSGAEITSVCLPDGLASIGAQAFMSCNGLRKIYIPSTVTSITGSAFSDCRTMMEYHFMGDTPPELSTAGFTNIASSCVFYVPYSADHSILEEYQTATNWSTYASRMQEEPQS